MIGGAIPGSLMFNGEAIKTATIEQDQVRKGNVFTCNNFIQDIVGGGTVDILFDPTAFSGSRLRMLVPKIIVTNGPIEWEVYAGVTANNDGTLCNVFNRNFNSPKVPESVVRIDPTGIVLPATYTARKIIPSSSTGAASSEAGTASIEVPLGIKTDIKYLLRAINKDASALAYLEYLVTWFEVS